MTEPLPPEKPSSSDPEKVLGNSQEDTSELGNLNRQLYVREEPKDIKTRITKLRSTKVTDKASEKYTLQQPGLVNVMEARKKRHQRILLITIGIIVVLGLFAAAVGATVWYRSSHHVTQSQLGLKIEAPTEFTAGEHITYTVRYKNESRVDWKNVEVLFEPPQNFIFSEAEKDYRLDGRRYIFSLGDLASGKDGSFTVTGQLLGAQNEVASARMELNISPINFDRVRITTSQVISTTIVSVPIRISVEATENAASGEKVVAKIRVQNTSSQSIENLRLRLEPSGGIQLATEDQIFTAGFSVLDSWWELPKIEPFVDAVYNVVIYPEGSAGERRNLGIKVLYASDGDPKLLSETNHLITISASELFVDQVFNDQKEVPAVNPGDRIIAKVEYKNIGTTGLSNIVIKTKLEAPGFDPTTLRLTNGGAYNPTERTITWTAASVPQLISLQPQQGGTLEYEFVVLAADKFPTGENDKNQAIIVTSTVDSTDLPTPVGGEQRVISSRTTLPINTDLLVAADAFYDDGRLGLPSSGPLPPEVGKQTTYTIRFRLGSALSDIGNVRLRAVLPDGVKYTTKSYKTAGEFVFNERAQEIVWTIPQVEGLSGRVRPGPELHVQVAVTPGENVRGQRLLLVKSVEAEATDLYTDQQVQDTISTLPSTETADNTNGIVK